MNSITRSLAFVAAFAAGAATAAELSVDLTGNAGTLRPALHSSGWGPQSYPRTIYNSDNDIKAMNLAYARTHDWALINSGQRVVDYQYVFPLMHLDAKDPKNYLFGPTDHLLNLSRNLGLKIFYRLGTSIEHTGDIHFNARVPDDFDKVAEIFAGTIRHYNRGWADGHKWNIEYWEIWNEPDGIGNMWCLPADKGGKDHALMREKFIRFFVTCLKRLKSEFPEVKVGGPALCWLDPSYFRPLLKACREAGVAPDFISWHYYGANPKDLVATTHSARKLCDEFGFTKTELVINEYHYLLSWDGIHGNNSTPAMVKRALDGPTGHNSIDAACFYLTLLSQFQTSPLDQAYWYGCGTMGNWGYLDGYRQFNKPYYAAKLFGGVLNQYSAISEMKANGTFTTLAMRSKDGKKAALLLTDYRGVDQLLSISVKGAEKAKRVTASVLDHSRDLIPCSVDWHDNRLTLVKADKNSAAYLVTFEY